MNHWVKKGENGFVFYFVYGSSILAYLFIWHITDMDSLFVFMHRFFLEYPLVFKTILTYKYFICIITFLSVLLVSTVLFINRAIQFSIWGALQYALLCFLIISLPLLVSFTFYFAAWHSILSIRNIERFLRLKNNSYHLFRIHKQSILFSVIAIAGIGIIYLLGQISEVNIDWVLALVITLSVLTLPHLEVMHTMYQKFKQINIPS
jgi:Brp/Blh family beta-carotene 15,15'-monooxygenase